MDLKNIKLKTQQMKNLARSYQTIGNTTRKFMASFGRHKVCLFTLTFTDVVYKLELKLEFAMETFSNCNCYYVQSNTC